MRRCGVGPDPGDQERQDGYAQATAAHLRDEVDPDVCDPNVDLVVRVADVCGRGGVADAKVAVPVGEQQEPGLERGPLVLGPVDASGHPVVARVVQVPARPRTLHTGADLLTDRQHQRIEALFADDAHVQVEVTWGVYQATIAAYREPDRARGQAMMAKLIETLSHGVPAALSDVTTLGRTLKKRAPDVLAYFERPGTSNGPTEAINGRLEHLRGIALGFRNLTHYIARSLLETGGFRPQLHARMR